MPKEEWGTKRLCPTTGRRFFDLNKTPIVSPYTGEVIEFDTGNKSRVLVADKPDPKEVQKKEVQKKETAPDETDAADKNDVIDDGDDGDAALGDDVLDDNDDEVSLDEIADVAADDE